MNAPERDIGSIPGVPKSVIDSLDLLGEIADGYGDEANEAWDTVHAELARFYEQQARTPELGSRSRLRRRRRRSR